METLLEQKYRFGSVIYKALGTIGVKFITISFNVKYMQRWKGKDFWSAIEPEPANDDKLCAFIILIWQNSMQEYCLDMK